MTALKTAIQKKFPYYKQTLLASLDPRVALYEGNGSEIEVGLQFN